MPKLPSTVFVSRIGQTKLSRGLRWSAPGSILGCSDRLLACQTNSGPPKSAQICQIGSILLAFLPPLAASWNIEARRRTLSQLLERSGDSWDLGRPYGSPRGSWVALGELLAPLGHSWVVLGLTRGVKDALGTDLGLIVDHPGSISAPFRFYFQNVGQLWGSFKQLRHPSEQHPPQQL